MNRKFIIFDTMTKRVIIQDPNNSDMLMLAPEPSIEELMKGEVGTPWEKGFIFETESIVKKMLKKFGKGFAFWPLIEENGVYRTATLKEL